ncbi:MAG: DUF192 domain-containing protein [Alphaproteobacteria bacterium]
MLRRLLLIVLVAIATPAAAQLVGFAKSTVEIETADGRRHKFRVELAITSAQQMQGLMYRKALDPDQGMLFLYDADQPMAMWMKNTYVPLDIAFLRADGRIINIHRDVPPLTLEPRPSDGPARAAIELPAGTAERLGIKPGDRVIHPRLAGP